MILQIEAIDTLFFRDGKPFSMGEETWANSMFPPLPSVFYGALRSAYFAQHPELLSKANTVDDPTKSLRIRGVWLMKGNTSYFPIPAEMVEKEVKLSEKKAEKRVLYGYFEISETFFSSSPLNLNPYTDEVSGPSGFLSKAEMGKYLKDQFTETDDFATQEAFVTKENKIGIGRQNTTRTTEEGKLYRVQLNRMQPTANVKTYFLVETNWEDLPKAEIPSFIKLGGENKIAKCLEFTRTAQATPAEISGQTFKLYLQTPAIFRNGWLPSCFSFDETEQAYIGELKIGERKEKCIKLKLLRAFVGGSLPVGGFDLKKRQPKTMYRAVPAGSVYHFEVLSEGVSSEDLHQAFADPSTPLCEVYPEQGFGLSLIAQLNQE